MPIYTVECKECGNTRDVLTLKIDPDTIVTADCECGVNDWKRIISVARGKVGDIDAETRQTEEMCRSNWV